MQWQSKGENKEKIQQKREDRIIQQNTAESNGRRSTAKSTKKRGRRDYVRREERLQQPILWRGKAFAGESSMASMRVWKEVWKEVWEGSIQEYAAKKRSMGRN